jgi:signal transduction histidine kinase
MTSPATNTDRAPGGPEAAPRRRLIPVAAVWVIVLSALLIALDIISPEQITVGVLYVLPLLAGISLDSERALYVLTGLMVAAIFASFLVFANGENFQAGLINRALAAIAMFGVAYLAGRQIRTNRELESQKRQLAHLMELQMDFVRAVSHDIRAPIGAVLGYVELLESSTGVEPLPESQMQLLHGIRRSCRNVVALTDNLLTAAKLDTGDFPVEHDPVDLTALVHDIVHEMVSLARGNSERIQLTAPSGITITSDPIRLRQILVNLISNALKYSPREECVSVAVHTHDGSVYVNVADRGPGIPLEERERIFEPFYQSASRRKRGGVGLGLPLARRLARALGGDITVESTVGKGSVFTLRLPATGSARPA